MNSLINSYTLKSVITGIIASGFIWWCVWIVHANLTLLQENECNPMKLLTESTRALLSTIVVLVLIAFL